MSELFWYLEEEEVQNSAIDMIGRELTDSELRSVYDILNAEALSSAIEEVALQSEEEADV